MKTKPGVLLAAIVVAGSMSACATTLPGTLVEARYAYLASSSGLAATMAPRELLDAKKMLDRANDEFQFHGGTAMCRDYSYIAENKLELADAVARTEVDRQTMEDAAGLDAPAVGR
jgi:Domain of unknown function (DUF4398)